MQILFLYNVFQVNYCSVFICFDFMHHVATVKPPISNHLKCKKSVVAYKTQTTGGLLHFTRSSPDTTYFLERM